MNFSVRNFLENHKILLKNTVFVFALNVIQRILGLATLYVLVRTLDQTQFGDYQFVLSLLGVLTIFALPGLNNAIMQSTARGMEGNFRLSLKPSFLSSLIGSLILFGIGTWYWQVKDSDLYRAFYVAAAFFPFAYSLKGWKAVIVGRENFSSLLMIDGIFSLLTAVFVISISLAVPGSVFWPLVVVVSIPAFQNLLFTIYSLKKIDREASVEGGHISYGIKTTIYSSLNIIANHIDKLLIYAFLSPAALAVYFAAERISQISKSAAQDISTVLAPRFAKMDTYSKSLDQKLKLITFVLGVLIVVFAFSVLPWLVTFLFGAQYGEAIPYTQALLCSVVIGNHAALKHKFINSQLDEKSYRDAIASVSLIRILSSLLLIPFFGIVGAIISTYVFRICTIFILDFIIRRRYKDSSNI